MQITAHHIFLQYQAPIYTKIKIYVNMKQIYSCFDCFFIN